MTAVIGALRVDLGLETAEFKKGAKEAQNTATELYQKLKETALHIAEAFALEKLYEGFKSIVEGMESIVLTAQKMGVPVETLSKMQLAADITHTSMESLAGGVEKLSKNLEAVAGGKGGNAALALRAIGVSATDANGKLKPTEDVLLSIAGKFEKSADGANKTAIAIALFGKSGAELIPFLNRGKDGISAFMAKADELGLTISENTAAKIEAFSQDITTMQDALVGIGRQIAVAVLPQINQLTSDILKFADSKDAVQIFADQVSSALQSVRELFIELKSDVESLTETWKFLQLTPSEAWNGGWDAFLAKQKEITAQFDKNIAASRLFFVQTGPGKGDLDSPGTDKPSKPQLPGFTNLEVSDQAAAAARRHSEAIKELIAQLKIQNEEFTKGALQMKIEETLRSHKVDALSKEGQEISALIIKHAKLQAAEQTSLQEAENLTKRKEQFMAGLTSIAQLGVSEMEQFAEGAKSLGDVLGDLLKQLAQMVVQAALLGQGPLGGMFSGGGAGGGLLGSIFTGIFGGGGLYGGALAGGGPVSPGKGYIVGENGPEWFQPNGSGTIMPNGGTGGGVQVNVNNYGAADGVGVTARKNSNGSVDLDVMMTRKVNDTISSGQADGAMGMRLGASPVRTRR